MPQSLAFPQHPSGLPKEVQGTSRSRPTVGASPGVRSAATVDQLSSVPALSSSRFESAAWTTLASFAPAGTCTLRALNPGITWTQTCPSRRSFQD